MPEKQKTNIIKQARVLQVTGGMNLGGAETMLMNLYRNIDRSTLQFDFVSFTKEKCRYDDEITALGGRIFYVPPPKNGNVISFILGIYKVIKNNGPYQAVHAHTLFNSGFALLAARMAGIKLRICHSHNTLGDQSYKLTRKIYFSIMRVLINLNTTKAVACTNAAGEFLFGKTSDEKKCFEVLYNAVDLTPYKNIDSNELIRMKKELSIGKDTLVLGHVGKFGEQKNHMFLVKLAEYMKKREIDFKLLLIGEGDLKREIQDVIKQKGLENSVLFLGVQRNIPMYMRLFDVFVFPSFYEGLGIVLIEAQAAGTPCVISDTIPEECDMGLGLIKMLNLEEPLDIWCKEIYESSKIQKLSPKVTINPILRNGYNLKKTVLKLNRIYNVQ